MFSEIFFIYPPYLIHPHFKRLSFYPSQTNPNLIFYAGVAIYIK